MANLPPGVTLLQLVAAAKRDPEIAFCMRCGHEHIQKKRHDYCYRCPQCDARYWRHASEALRDIGCLKKVWSRKTLKPIKERLVQREGQHPWDKTEEWVLYAIHDWAPYDEILYGYTSSNFTRIVYCVNCGKACGGSHHHRAMNTYNDLPPPQYQSQVKDRLAKPRCSVCIENLCTSCACRLERLVGELHACTKICGDISYEIYARQRGVVSTRGRTPNQNHAVHDAGSQEASVGVPEPAHCE